MLVTSGCHKKATVGEAAGAHCPEGAYADNEGHQDVTGGAPRGSCECCCCRLSFSQASGIQDNEVRHICQDVQRGYKGETTQ